MVSCGLWTQRWKREQVEMIRREWVWMTRTVKKERERSQFDPVMEKRRQQDRAGQRKDFTRWRSCWVSPKMETARVRDSDRKKDRERRRERKEEGEGREKRQKDTSTRAHTDTHTYTKRPTKTDTRERGFGRNRKKYIHMRDRQKRTARWAYLHTRLQIHTLHPSTHARMHTGYSFPCPPRLHKKHWVGYRNTCQLEYHSKV